MLTPALPVSYGTVLNVSCDTGYNFTSGHKGVRCKGGAKFHFTSVCRLQTDTTKGIGQCALLLIIVIAKKLMRRRNEANTRVSVNMEVETE